MGLVTVAIAEVTLKVTVNNIKDGANSTIHRACMQLSSEQCHFPALFSEIRFVIASNFKHKSYFSSNIGLHVRQQK